MNWPIVAASFPVLFVVLQHLSGLFPRTGSMVCLKTELLSGTPISLSAPHFLFFQRRIKVLTQIKGGKVC